MRRTVFLCLIAASLTACPFRPSPSRLVIAIVRVVATCPTPGEGCEFEHFTDLEAGVFESFDIVSDATRDADEDFAEDDVTVSFVSTVPVMGYHAGMNNDVAGDLQTLTVEHAEGIDSIDGVYNWKMKIALDDQNQYELTMVFYGPAQ